MLTPDKILLILILSVSTLCNYPSNNPLDEKGNNYDPPIIIIDSIKDHDTILLNTAVIVLQGNRPQSQFMIQVNGNNLYEEWVPEGTYTLSDLEKNTYTVKVSTRYKGGTLVFYDSVTFYVQLTDDTIPVEIKKPYYAIKTDTIITGNRPIKIIGTALGTPPINYAWFSANSLLSNKDTFNLTSKLDSVYCVAANSSGSDTSRTFIFKLNSVVKGNITDSAGKKLDGVKVTIGDSNIVSNSNIGEFIFKELSSGTYKISINHTGYCDTVISGIAVNNDDTIIKNVILNKITTIDTLPKDTSDTVVVIDTTYKVFYNGNGNDSGNTPVDVILYHVGDTVTILSSNNLSKKGYDFSGWTTILSDSLLTFISGEYLIMGSGNVILTAQWIAKALYTLSYDGNNSTGGFIPSSTTHIDGTYVKVSQEGTLSKTGNRFIGWNTNKDPTKGIDYSSGSTILMKENITLYARWEKNKYPLKYVCTNNDAGTVPLSSIQEYEADIIIAIPSLIKTGYSFKSWNDKPDGTGKSYASGETIKMYADSLILYAQWNNPTGMIIVPSKDKTFVMGGKIPVKLTKNFWCDTTEVTQGAFNTLMSATYPSIYQKPDWDAGTGEDYPAYYTSWYIAALYCNARTKLTGSIDTVYAYKAIEGTFSNCNLTQLTIDYNKKGFRLPTEAEYEFAARGGSTITQYSPEQLSGIAWYYENSGSTPHQVAQKKENGYGLHDILGNLREWVNELYYTYPNQSDMVIDPVNGASIDPVQDNNKWTYRGGSWDDDLDRNTCIFRYFKASGNGDFYTGFRCCLPIQE